MVTAGRVYLELATETISDRDGLYNLARSVAWHEYFALEQSFAVASHTAHPAFRSENLAALIVKDAVADHFRDRTGERPSVDSEAPDARLYVHLTTRSTSLYLDLSGESLHQR
ncbi:MAG: THUMP domain-containing protein, partial [Spirochaetia bacterium]